MGSIMELLVKILGSLQILKISNLLSQFSVLQFSERMANTALSKLKQEVVLVTGKITNVGNLNNNRVINTTSTARYNPHTQKATGNSTTSVSNNYFISELAVGDVNFINLGIFDRRIWESMEAGDQVSMVVYNDFQSSENSANDRSYWGEFIGQVSAVFYNIGSIDQDVLVFFKTDRIPMTFMLRTSAWTERYFGKLIFSCSVAWLKVFVPSMVVLGILSSMIKDIEFLSEISENFFFIFFLFSLIPALNIMHKGNEYVEQLKKDVFAFMDSVNS
jgi:hypothetical protein